MSSNRPPMNAAGRLLPVGSFRGVPLYFAPSWVLIATLITITYNSIIYDLVDGISRPVSYLFAFVFALLLAVCVLAHELGHTAVSLVLGQPVNRVVIFLLGGVSEIEGEIRRPRDEVLIALAGPLVSLALAGAAWAGFAAAPDATVLSVLLALLMWSNLVVAVFNLLPGLPLDGGRALRAGVWGATHSRLTGTRVAAWSGRVLAVVVAAGSVLINVDGVNWGLGTAVFGLALGAFIWIAATQALRVAEMQQRLPRLSMQRLLRPGLFVHADTPVSEAIRRASEARAGGLVVIDSANQPQAIVDETRIGAVPFDRRPWVPVSDVARPLEPGMVLGVDLTGDALLAALRHTPAHEYLVVHPDGSAAGILSARDLLAELSRPAA
ncbi:MAG TPA: site-2 protease family protein [Jatrophihabitantaceae bacterium]